MTQPFLGEVRIFSGTYAPHGWAFCKGQQLDIMQNQALFSLLGTTYGGNGTTSFNLPNLQQRIPLHPGTGPGLSPRTLGEMGGEAATQLQVSQMPSHNHSLNATPVPASQPVASNVLLARPNVQAPPYHDTADLGLMPPGSLSNTGGNVPHNNLQPFLVLNFIIALEGIYPSQA